MLCCFLSSPPEEAQEFPEAWISKVFYGAFPEQPGCFYDGCRKSGKDSDEIQLASAEWTHLTMSVIQEPSTITSNVSSVMIWLRQVCYFQSTHLLTHIFKHVFCSVGPVRHFPEETQNLKPNRLFEAKPGNIWKLFWQPSNETYLFILCISMNTKEIWKKGRNGRCLADGAGQNPVLLRV